MSSVRRTIRRTIWRALDHGQRKRYIKAMRRNEMERQRREYARIKALKWARKHPKPIVKTYLPVKKLTFFQKIKQFFTKLYNRIFSK
jgi:hypothetical protein